MGNSADLKDNEKKSGFAVYAAKKIIIIAVVLVIGLWGLLKIVNLMDKPENIALKTEERPAMLSPSEVGAVQPGEISDPHKATSIAPATAEIAHETGNSLEPVRQGSISEVNQQNTAPAGSSPIESQTAKTQSHTKPMVQPETKPQTSFKGEDQDDSSGSHPFKVTDVKKPKGVAFVEALMEPLNYELNQRHWGWRPNDIIDLTDNVNNMQLGILEFTRRTSIVFAEKISRTGATASFDPNLQQAMNWFMIKAEQYWLPSPEDKYNEGLKNLRTYKSRLENGTASFYTRNDNLIPLLSVYEDLLGGCEENLVKATEQNGDPVSYFVADDYFYYAKGVAMAMLPVLEAISVDFATTVENRRGTDVLRHAIEALHHAIEIDPIIITNSALDGILANHRANLAAPISHARFYLGVLIKTLST
ncbi:MAG: DUF2333 family protein [Desulfobacteraceae bacterium]|nr:DUF2333 family protein [Desulfobacteraceae bacterium]MBU4053309.1 DUF2333 family protein [Pseudomonadota bacterium]